ELHVAGSNGPGAECVAVLQPVLGLRTSVVDDHVVGRFGNGSFLRRLIAKPLRINVGPRMKRIAYVLRRRGDMLDPAGQQLLVEIASNLGSWQRAHETVRQRNVLVMTSIMLSWRSARSWHVSAGECTCSPRNQKPEPRIDSSKPSVG